MKKIARMALAILIVVLISDVAYATQGTCSSHGGIDCDQGPDIDGSAICHDGWKDSSESFYDADKCDYYFDDMSMGNIYIIQRYHMIENLIEIIDIYNKYKDGVWAKGALSIWESNLNNIASLEKQVIDSFHRDPNFPRNVYEKAQYNESANFYNLVYQDVLHLRYLIYAIDQKHYIDLNVIGKPMYKRGFFEKLTMYSTTPKECPYNGIPDINGVCWCKSGTKFINCEDVSEVQPAAETSEYKTLFKDVSTKSNYAKGINYLYSKGVIKGYEDNTFRGYNNINRAELLKMLVAGQDINPDINVYKNCFPDVKSEWFAPYVCYAKDKQWVGGYDDGTFKPAQTVTKSEAIKMILNALNVQSSTFHASNYVRNPPFKDIQFEEWFSKYVYTACYYQYLDCNIKAELNNGVAIDWAPDQYFPAKQITRNTVAEIMYRILYSREKEDKRYEYE